MYYIFEPGEDNCTMGNVLSRVKDMFPTPENQRPKLLLCDNVLERGIDELYNTIRAYLERYCHDYNEKTTKLQLHATLIFVEKQTLLYLASFGRVRKMIETCETARLLGATISLAYCSRRWGQNAPNACGKANENSSFATKPHVRINQKGP